MASHTTLFARTDVVQLVGAALLPAAAALFALRGAGALPALSAAKLNAGLLLAGGTSLWTLLHPATAYLFRPGPSVALLAGLAAAVAVAGAWGLLAAGSGPGASLAAAARSLATPDRSTRDATAFSAASLALALAGAAKGLAYKGLHDLFWVRIPFKPILSAQFAVYGGCVRAPPPPRVPSSLLPLSVRTNE